MCCPLRAKLARKQTRLVKKLQDELTRLVAEGNDYWAHDVRRELIAAQSLNRLIHKHMKEG